MKVAVTADLHLTSQEEHPERYNALRNILEQMLAKDVKILIIAGDLFDAESQNYSEFDEFCKQPLCHEISFYIIPGNHDLSIKPKSFTASNIRVFDAPAIIQLGDPTTTFLFIPYLNNKSMGEVVAENKAALVNKWVLIGHGDYISGLREPNPYEAGIYMPLTRKDLEYYDPAIVLLGHIHKKMNLGKVHYPGSPSGLDISETGRRSFLLFDTNNLNIDSQTIDSDYIFWNETIIALPAPDEFGYAKKNIEKMIQEWNMVEAEVPKARIRLKVKGYTSDRARLLTVIEEALRGFTFYENKSPDLTEVSVFNEPERIDIVEKVREEIERLEWNDEITTKDDILEQALHLMLTE